MKSHSNGFISRTSVGVNFFGSSIIYIVVLFNKTYGILQCFLIIFFTSYSESTNAGPSKSKKIFANYPFISLYLNSLPPIIIL
jgi:hypothetical protein